MLSAPSARGIAVVLRMSSAVPSGARADRRAVVGVAGALAGMPGAVSAVGRRRRVRPRGGRETDADRAGGEQGRRGLAGAKHDGAYPSFVLRWIGAAPSPHGDSISCLVRGRI